MFIKYFKNLRGNLAYTIYYFFWGGGGGDRLMNSHLVNRTHKNELFVEFVNNFEFYINL